MNPTRPLAPPFAEWLDAPGPPFSANSPVHLSDVFVRPSLTVRGRTTSTPADPVEFALDAGHLLVSGPSRVGRTTFAKRIVAAALDRDETAIYVRGDFLHHQLHPQAVAAAIKAVVAAQHGRTDVPDLVVIDDLDRARLAAQRGAQAVGRHDVLAAVTAHVPRVVAFTTEHDLASLLNAWPQVRFTSAALGSMSRARRSELAGRFAEAVVPHDGWRDFVAPARRVLDDLFGEDSIPSFPYYILSALGELFTNKPAHLIATGYGPYFEVVIRQAIASAKRHGLRPRRPA